MGIWSFFCRGIRSAAGRFSRLFERLHRAFQRRGIPLSENDSRITALRNLHRGKRCFVVGNGPSLRREDLDRLNGEISFGANRIYVAFKETPWRPTYYLICDELSALNCIREIPRIRDSQKIFPFDLLYHLPRYRDVIYYERVVSDPCAFSRNMQACLYEGQTVLYMALQMAVYMGVSEIYLIGVDFSYPEPEKVVDSGDFGDYELHVATGQKSHFSPDYYRHGEVFKEPKFREQELAFEEARITAESSGVGIFNATRGGKLEVFERRDFDSLF